MGVLSLWGVGFRTFATRSKCRSEVCRAAPSCDGLPPFHVTSRPLPVMINPMFLSAWLLLSQ